MTSENTLNSEKRKHIFLRTCSQIGLFVVWFARMTRDGKGMRQSSNSEVSQ